MVKNIVTDEEFLKIVSTDLTKDELYIVEDLIDTLKIHLGHCVGMAANMIGYSKNAIVIVQDNQQILPLINPKIIEKKDPYLTSEGCLSLKGERDALRYQKIKVEYFDINFKKRIKTFTSFEAQIVEHEIDHLFGIII